MVNWRSVRSKLHDVENQRAPKLALFERGVDIVLVFLIYDALQTVKPQLQLQVGECCCRALLRHVPKFVLQLAVFFWFYHGYDCEFKVRRYHDLGDAVPLM